MHAGKCVSTGEHDSRCGGGSLSDVSTGQELCVSSKYAYARFHTVRESSNFAALVEDLFEKTDAFYTVADKAIDFLPIQAGRVVRVASVRSRNPRENSSIELRFVFKERTRLSFLEKLAIARRIIPAVDLFQMAIAEAFFFVFLRLYVVFECEAREFSIILSLYHVSIMSLK